MIKEKEVLNLQYFLCSPLINDIGNNKIAYNFMTKQTMYLDQFNISASVSNVRERR